MGKDRPADDDVVVVDDETVQRDRDALVQPAVGQFRDVAGGDRAQVRNVVGSSHR